MRCHPPSFPSAVILLIRQVRLFLGPPNSPLYRDGQKGCMCCHATSCKPFWPPLYDRCAQRWCKHSWSLNVTILHLGGGKLPSAYLYRVVDRKIQFCRRHPVEAESSSRSRPSRSLRRNRSLFAKIRSIIKCWLRLREFCSLFRDFGRDRIVAGFHILVQDMLHSSCWISQPSPLFLVPYLFPRRCFEEPNNGLIRYANIAPSSHEKTNARFLSAPSILLPPLALEKKTERNIDTRQICSESVLKLLFCLLNM